MPLSRNNISKFQFKPLDQNARMAVFDVLKECDFTTETMVREEYPFPSINGRKFKANAIVFTHETHRTPDYTGFSVFNATDDCDEHNLVSILAHSAAPFHFIHRNKKKNFSFWFSNAKDRKASDIESRKIKSDVSYDNLSNALRDYSEDLKRHHIIKVKQGLEEFNHPSFKETGPFQLSLWAIDATGESLVKHFGRAVNNLSLYRDLNTGEAITKKDVTNIAIQLLGAVILADTGSLGLDIQKKKPGIENLIYAAKHKFPNYFDTQLIEQWKVAAESTYNTLTELCYSGFSPEMLTNLYREAYPDKDDRKALGRYDTPLYLTRRIWNTIPVEFLPPEKRIIADMTCGWGSFLIAGYERMSRMIDMKSKPLRELITGNDKDNFTARLAGLGLLISTSEDSWDIESIDSEKWMEKKYGKNGPGIIVGNPPFGGNRQTISGQKHRYQMADKFMGCAIRHLSPGGYLAMIMPQSFTVSEASHDLRKKLLADCDVLEIWELPIGVFAGATANTIVIFARKKKTVSRSAFPVRIRTLQKNTLDSFQEIEKFTASAIATNPTGWNENSRRKEKTLNTHIMDYTHILPKTSWDKIKENCTNLSEITEIITGATVGKNPNKKRWRDYSDPKKVNWLRSAKKSIKNPFHLVYDDASTIIYPNEFVEPRKNKKNPQYDKEYLFKDKKIILASTVNPSWGKRLKVAIERKGFYVSDSFIVIAPKKGREKKHITHEVIASVLNWKVSNAWIVEHLKYPRIPLPILRRIPFPRLSKKECEILTQSVMDIECSIKSTQNNELIDSSFLQIDNILKSAYGIEDEEYERIKSIYEWDTTPMITLDKLPDGDENWKTTGVVDSINSEEGTITFWMSDFDELQTVSISPSMPGWLLRPEVAFRACIPRESVRKGCLDNVSLGKFKPQNYTYLNEEQIFDRLTKVLS